MLADKPPIQNLDLPSRTNICTQAIRRGPHAVFELKHSSQHVIVGRFHSLAPVEVFDRQMKPAPSLRGFRKPHQRRHLDRPDTIAQRFSCLLAARHSLNSEEQERRRP
jgi:hypothetical protein